MASTYGWRAKSAVIAARTQVLFRESPKVLFHALAGSPLEGGCLGAWYVFAAVALVVPALPRVKEWAYAGVVFAMTGAFAAHLFAGDAIADWAPSLVLTSLAVASYVLRPASRRLGGGSEV